MNNGNECDASHAAHELLASQELATGWRLVFAITTDRTHGRLELHEPGHAAEVIGCLHANAPVAASDWGFELVDVLKLIQHCVWHVTAHIRPGACDAR